MPLGQFSIAGCRQLCLSVTPSTALLIIVWECAHLCCHGLRGFCWTIHAMTVDHCIKWKCTKCTAAATNGFQQWHPAGVAMWPAHRINCSQFLAMAQEQCKKGAALRNPAGSLNMLTRYCAAKSQALKMQAASSSKSSWYYQLDSISLEAAPTEQRALKWSTLPIHGNLSMSLAII